MAQQVQKKHSEKAVDTTVEEKEKTENHQDLKDELDALLDEIDEVLEENAQEFVNSFIQKGGE